MTRLSFFFILTILFSMTSCKKDVLESNLKIFISHPLGSSANEPIPRDLKYFAEKPFLCGDTVMVIPIIEVTPINDLEKSSKLTDQISKSFSGDQSNSNRAERKLKEQLDKATIGELLSKSIELEREELISTYSKIIKESAPNSLFILTDGSFPLDSITERKDIVVIQKFSELRNLVNDRLCAEGQTDIQILLNPHLPRIEPPKEKEAPELMAENEVAFEKDDKTKLKEIGEELKTRLDKDPLQWRLWYALAINRMKLGFLNEGIDHLRSAAKEAIDMGEAEELLRFLEKKEGFINQKYKNSSKPKHTFAVFTALKKNEKCLVDVITQTMVKEAWHKIGKNTVNLIPAIAGFYRNSHWGFRINVKEKYNDQTILVDMFIPNKTGTVEKLDFKLRLGQEFRARLSDDKLGDDEWQFIFINESPSDCSHVKIRYDINKIDEDERF